MKKAKPLNNYDKMYSRYGIYDHMTELPIPEAVDDVAGRGAGGALKVNSPGDRARFRHDPYPRVPSST
ncbi:hypothetical protein SK128_010581 [Halocaridina rubra]|uniref:Uncharacterized protein n=1 Tax=Halocaridina rubra TaxID=373956 RepID=A0AAN8XUN5_HALRR